MRYIYLLTAALFCSFFSNGQQLQNSNWCFGNGAGLSFSTSTPTGFSSSISTIEATATVSDQNGDLIFYSNGSTVWNKNHQVMTNGTGLFGNPTSSQGAVIIPRDKGKEYYLVYIYGVSGNSTSPGLYYSIIDIGDSTGLGEVVSTTKNTPLRDHNNVPIDQNYLVQYPDGMHKVRSEQVTVAKHCNGEDFWLITQISDKIYVYLVNSNGIGPTPTTVTQAPIPNSPVGYMKVSPNGERIGFCIFNYFEDTSSGGVLMGDFNNATGEITLDSNPIAIPSSSLNYSTNYYGLEFSPSSKYVYVSMGDITFGQDIYRGNAYNTSTFTQINGVTKLPYKAIGLQLGMDGKIYVANGSTQGNQISVITDPDNPTNPGYQDLAITIPNATTNTGFPQLVHWHDIQCDPYVILENPETISLAYTRSYSDYIITENNYSVSDNQNITLEANNYILMEPNTTIDSGSIFLAHIKECGVCETSTQARTSFNEKSSMNSLKDNKGFKVYPNPTNGIINIQFETNVNEFAIYDITGKQLMNISNTAENQAEIDLSNLAAGVYFLTADGVPIQKIVKN
ncbi:T9SS type A sorting domain-containing protein [Flavobacterium rakeshii]|uniref:T9SS type A sorting domain-containing protein n=1 Tax=Flavobacterium rakeshii TaxID=1038845 RepID=UPI002E7AC99F|nr:T9SS type A sorting domain-containing protein [Flavobacterium rakeshii]MEE1899618.1 T9SS type A sorting domain-containing protein [Flavobacterium rakeshii]